LNEASRQNWRTGISISQTGGKVGIRQEEKFEGSDRAFDRHLRDADHQLAALPTLEEAGQPLGPARCVEVEFAEPPLLIEQPFDLLGVNALPEELLVRGNSSRAPPGRCKLAVPAYMQGIASLRQGNVIAHHELIPSWASL
jgi:hypothetical protein